MSPVISIIIPCFNQANFLADAINSVISQSFFDWECIIVNDGSTDNTVEVASSFTKTDGRIRLINQKNKGLSGARNTGIDAANGRYIQFLDADDLIDPQKLSIQVEALQDVNELAVCYSDYRRCPENNIQIVIDDGEVCRPTFVLERPLYDIAARWETELSIPIHCFLFDARIFKEKAIHFDEKLPNHEDWDCWMRVFSLNPIVKYTPGMLAVYRINTTSMCANHAKMWQGFRAAIIKQKKLFRNQLYMRKLLSKKMNGTRRFYIKKLMSLYFKQNIENSYLYKRKVPWPIQKYINQKLKF